MVLEMLAGGLSGLGMSAVYQGFGSGTNCVANKVLGSGTQKADAGWKNVQVPSEVKSPAAKAQQDSGKVTFEDVVASGNPAGQKNQNVTMDDVVYMVGDEKGSSNVLQAGEKNGIIEGQKEIG